MATEQKPPEGACQVPGYPDYWVTRNGVIWSRPRRGLRWRAPGGLLSLHDHGRCLLVNLRRDNVAASINVGAVVLMTFVGPRPAGHECCHNNGDYHDNYVENLRWGTSKENAQDRIRHGHTATGERNGNVALTVVAVKEIRRRYALANGPSHRQLAREFGVTHPTIRSIVNGRTWRQEL